jgi:hypothetical protein
VRFHTLLRVLIFHGSDFLLPCVAPVRQSARVDQEIHTAMSKERVMGEEKEVWVDTRREADEGAATAEYAIATMAAVGFAGLLVVIMRGDEVRQILTDLVRSALTFAG